MRRLARDYSAEFDSVDENTWYNIVRGFNDANIYQTWAYNEVRSGRKNVSCMVLKRNEVIVAAAQLRMARVPILNAGVAYVRWGPLYRPKDSYEDLETFAQALRALRNEYACRRGLVLRVYPYLFDDESERYLLVFQQEGFSLLKDAKRERTLVINLQPKLEDLRKGLNQKWRNCLNRAEKNALEVLEGCGDELFGMFVEEIYRKMLARKKFAEPNDIDEFRRIQQALPEDLKMKITLCRHEGQLGTGSIFSAMGKIGVYLFGATNDLGMKSNGAYLQQWKFVEWLKENGFFSFDLNGISPETNPGTYKFKEGLCGKNGKDVYFLGQFQTYTNSLSCIAVRCGEALRSGYLNTIETVRG